VVREIRERMQASVEQGGHPRDLQVYDRSGRPCPRCGGRIQARGQGDGNRTTYWCPACQV
jgi:endonuclease-8